MTVYINESARDENKIVILQGSRTGRPKKAIAPSFRAISFRTGEEIWKLDIRKTRSYSRDNDSSALPLGNGLIFNVRENGNGKLFYKRETLLFLNSLKAARCMVYSASPIYCIHI